MKRTMPEVSAIRYTFSLAEMNGSFFCVIGFSLKASIYDELWSCNTY